MDIEIARVQEACIAVASMKRKGEMERIILLEVHDITTTQETVSVLDVLVRLYICYSNLFNLD